MPLPLRANGTLHMAIPLYGFLEGDTIGLLVLAEETETVLELARQLQNAASIRVAPHDDIEFVYNGKAVEPGLTVAQAGLLALDRFDVVWSDKL
jgi:Toluene-4-monooxygenase system protein B (TmoB)